MNEYLHGATALMYDEDERTYWFGGEKVVVDNYGATPYFESGNIGRVNGVVIRESHKGDEHSIGLAVTRAIARLPFSEA